MLLSAIVSSGAPSMGVERLHPFFELLAQPFLVCPNMRPAMIVHTSYLMSWAAGGAGKWPAWRTQIEHLTGGNWLTAVIGVSRVRNESAPPIPCD